MSADPATFEAFLSSMGVLSEGQIQQILARKKLDEMVIIEQAAQKQKSICPEHPEDIFSKMKIDTELSKLDDEEVQILKYVYKEIAYSSKMPYFAGNPLFAMRLLDFSEPNIENTIVGECQSGKSAEIAWTAWCSYFVLGCLPVIYVRNNGGKNQGSEDMICAILTLNDRITKVLLEAQMPTLSAKIRLSIENRRFLLEVATDTSKIEADGLVFRSAMVLITLMNAAQLKKMMEPFRRSRKQWFPATLQAPRGAGWEVLYTDSQEREVRGLLDLRTAADRIIRPDTVLQPGTVVRARKSADLCVQDGLLKSMQRYGEKDGKRRVLFIMDEADLTVGNPERNKNQGEKLLYQQRERGDAYGVNRGAREYVFGCVFVTATPQALFMCAWENARRGGQRKADDSEPDAELRTDSDDEPDPESDPDGRQPGAGARVLRPHVVFADRPDNYIAYETDGGPQNGLFVERKFLEERFQKVKNMSQIYREVWIAEQGSEEDWREMEREVVAKGDPVELWPGIELRYNQRTQAAQVHCADRRRRDEEQERAYQRIKGMYEQAREHQRGQSIWQQDGEAIQEMLFDMIVDGGGEDYRHALIISDKTKTIHKQRALADDVLSNFSGADGLAVATYNCVDGVAVRFSAAAHAAGDIMQQAFEATQRAARALQQDKEARGLPSGGAALAGQVSLSHDRLVLAPTLPIGVMYEGLKRLCSRIVVITGEIGGRGVAYHDLAHERILTDMYTAQEVFADASITQHGELLTQILGRLNTIEGFSARGVPVPSVRLWATRSVHDLHKHVLEEVRELCEAVIREKDYRRALWSRPLWITGETRGGQPIPLRMSRPAFSAKREAGMRGGGRRKAAITDRRHRGLRLTRPAPLCGLFPARSRCPCLERLPHSDGVDPDVDGDGGGGSSDGRPERRWDPASGVAWSAVEHSQFEVRVPPELLDEAAAARFCSGSEGAGLSVPGRRQPWVFLTLEAARGFVAAGAAGAKEALLFAVVCPPAMAGSPDLRGDYRTESESDSSESSPRPQRRRLDYAAAAPMPWDRAGSGVVGSVLHRGGSAAAAGGGGGGGGGDGVGSGSSGGVGGGGVVDVIEIGSD